MTLSLEASVVDVGEPSYFLFQAGPTLPREGKRPKPALISLDTQTIQRDPVHAKQWALQRDQHSGQEEDEQVRLRPRWECNEENSAIEDISVMKVGS